MSTVNGHVISTMLGPTSPIRATLMTPANFPKTVPVFGSIHSLVNLPEQAHALPQRRAA